MYNVFGDFSVSHATVIELISCSSASNQKLQNKLEEGNVVFIFRGFFPANVDSCSFNVHAPVTPRYPVAACCHVSCRLSQHI